MPEDKRGHFRFPVVSTVYVELISPEFGSNEAATIVKCKTLDVSRDGIRVTLEQALPVGAILQLGVELPAAAGTLFLVGEVRWSNPLPGTEATPSWAAGLGILNADESDIDNWVELLSSMEN